MNIVPEPLHALVFHLSPTEVMVGLFSSGRIVAQTVVPYREASKELISCVGSVMAQVSISLDELSYLACNIGPAPFTTLRTLVVTVNGLGYATGKPLIGVNGLLSLATESHKLMYRKTYALMNAFGGNIYYAVYDPSTEDIDCGMLSYRDMVEHITISCSKNPESCIHIVGHVTEFYKEYAQQLNNLPTQIDADITHASLHGIAKSTFHAWDSKQTSYELKPYYGRGTLCV